MAITCDPAELSRLARGFQGISINAVITSTLCIIVNGSGGDTTNFRITEDSIDRITEDGQQRVIE